VLLIVDYQPALWTVRRIVAIRFALRLNPSFAMNTFEIHHLQGGSWYAIYRGRWRFTDADGKGEQHSRDREREGALAFHRADAERDTARTLAKSIRAL
jgi:hypothetical protein